MDSSNKKTMERSFSSKMELFYGDDDHGNFVTTTTSTQKSKDDGDRRKRFVDGYRRKRLLFDGDRRIRFGYSDDDDDDDYENSNNNSSCCSKAGGRYKAWRYCLCFVGFILAILFVAFAVTNRKAEAGGNQENQLSTNFATDDDDEEEYKHHWRNSCYQPATCTDEVLDRVLYDTPGNSTCRLRIHHLINKKSFTRWDSCLEVSFKFADICGPCNPSGPLSIIDEQHSHDKKLTEEEEEHNTTDNDSTEVSCFHPSRCTEEVLDTMTETNATCGHHIHTLMKYHDKSLGDACLHVAVEKFPTECGGCDPTGGTIDPSSMTTSGNNNKYNTILKNLLAIVVLLGVLAFGTYSVNAFCRIRQEKKKQKQRRLLFTYLQHFDVEDVDLHGSPPGGWHGAYLNKLAYGINQKEGQQGYGNNDKDGGEEEEAAVLLTHSSVASDSLFMDDPVHVRPSLGYDVEDQEQQQQLYGDDLEPRGSSRINARNII